MRCVSVAVSVCLMHVSACHLSDCNTLITFDSPVGFLLPFSATNMSAVHTVGRCLSFCDAEAVYTE